MQRALVDAEELQYVRLYKERKTLERLDVFPFAFAYGAWLYLESAALLTSHDKTSVRVHTLAGVALVAAHILLYLFTIWSVDVRCFARFRRVGRLEEATIVKVVPHAFTGTRDIVPLERRNVDGVGVVSFSFRKLRFIWNENDGVFRSLKYPIDLTFAEYRRSAGHGRESAITAAVDRWGRNVFEVPIPLFFDLLKEQLVAPFFCFQVFCVGLWALDDFWYYSVMTLFMLVAFESTVVHQRLRNLAQVRALQQPRQPLKVYRCGRWTEISGDDLVPGDVVSLARPAGQEQDVVVQADMLLLAGSCIVDEAVLTGESTPQWKNPIGEATGDEVDSSELEPSAQLDIKRDRLHIVFGGTKLLQSSGDKEAHIRAPDGGCLAVVLRTGFGTAQGSLMRTILYSTERVTANNLETFGFILFLLLWAVAAAYYVLQHGLADPDRDRFKLFLNCVMILTSVVPPELPMELTIAVNASLVALARKKVFCTEPFRIPIAGKVTTCCFDKTGTLTSDHMVLEGVVGAAADSSSAKSSDAATMDLQSDFKGMGRPVARVLVGCQSLVKVDRSVVGDPVERAAMDALGWTVSGDAVIAPKEGGGQPKEVLNILHRYHFSSVLKRMSTVVKADVGSDTSYWVLMKGAPEVVAAHLAEVPPTYDRLYKHYAAEGARVLALAYKELPSKFTPSMVRHIPRHEAESDLLFGGFAVFRSPVKADSEPTLRMLRASQHQLVMITGDAALTACHTAAQVHIVTRKPLILSTPGPPHGAWMWRSPDETLEEPFDPEPSSVAALAEAYDLCLTGDALTRTHQGGFPEVSTQTLICHTSVFARVTPEQKELIVKTMRAAGLTVLMCGDGTNDVGALKGAHVGVALLPPPETAKDSDGAVATANGGSASSRGVGTQRLASQAGSATAPRPAQQTMGPGSKMLDDIRRRGGRITSLHERAAKQMDEMAAGETGDAPLVRPGDASMASPFTAKDPSVAPCLDILRQGRCTLVTTVQMFKILGLLSLSTAYSLSVLYLDGIKLGDFQATLAGMLTAGMFFFISNAKPLDTLSRQRPHPNIFSRYVFVSLLGQFAVHMAFLMHMQGVAHAAMAPEDRQLPDGDFKPNLINTVCFLANFAIQTMTFAVNYVGEPFATPLAQNSMFAQSIRWSVGIYIVLALDAIWGLNDWFSLVAMPTYMKIQMLGLGLGAFVACRGIERFARTAFPAALPPEKGQGGRWRIVAASHRM